MKQKTAGFLCMAMLTLYVLAEQDNEPYSYSRINNSELIFAEENHWYLEEFDSFGRPITGTFWLDNQILSTISWEYIDNQNTAYIKTEYFKDYKNIYEYNTLGKLIKYQQIYNQNDLRIEEEKKWNNNLLMQETKKTKDVFSKIDYVYNQNDELLEKKIFKNGSLVSIIRYIDSENWIETIIKEGNTVLTVVYKNGQKIKTQENTE